MKNVYQILCLMVSLSVILNTEATPTTQHKTTTRINKEAMHETQTVSTILVEATPELPNEAAMSFNSVNDVSFHQREAKKTTTDYYISVADEDQPSVSNGDGHYSYGRNDSLSHSDDRSKDVHSVNKRDLYPYRARCCYLDVFCIRGCRLPWERMRGKRQAQILKRYRHITGF